MAKKGNLSLKQQRANFKVNFKLAIPRLLNLDQKYPVSYTRTKAKQQVILSTEFYYKNAFLYDAEPFFTGRTNRI